MITWSRRYTFVAGVILILATNAVALLGVIYNRAGTPESTLMLTQRELGSPYFWNLNNDNSGLALRIQWRVLGEELTNNGINYLGVGGTPAWLNSSKLSELGFDVTKFENVPGARRYYYEPLPREVLLVLELDGPAYQAMLERAREHARKETELLAANPGKTEFERRAKSANDVSARETDSSSRLFVVDAGLDVAQLRAKYADRSRYAIVRGLIQAQSGGRRGAMGYVLGISINEVHVPLAYRQNLEPRWRISGQRPATEPARFGVSVAFGQRLEPWIVAVKDDR